jgi:hypothetical protein
MFIFYFKKEKQKNHHHEVHLLSNLFFLKNEPKTLALQGFYSLSQVLPFRKRTISCPNLTKPDLFFLKKEPKTLALRGFNSLRVLSSF